MIPARTHLLPPDPEAYRHAPHPRGRVIVIAPTRAACETIELALGLSLETVLEREHGAELREWAGTARPSASVAGTGTGKTLGIRLMAEAIPRRHWGRGGQPGTAEATPETPIWNVVVVTTGIARRWLPDDLVSARDTVVVDEIHQTSAELELCLALGTGRLSLHLAERHGRSGVLRPVPGTQRGPRQPTAFDPELKATVKVLPVRAEEFLDDKFIRHVIKQKRGVAVFVPTRAEVEQLAGNLAARWPRLTAAFYHGGEPIRIIRPFLEGEVRRPFLLAMTAAGQSALNIRGLDTVVIYDARYGTVVERGRNVLHRLYLGANEILQMAGRVHGRVAGGEVFILSDRELDFHRLRPVPPEFQLAGDAERVAITCAAIGVDASDLDLPVALDRVAYRRALETLTGRGLVDQGRLTAYGREVEALPVERPWGELLVQGEPELLPVLAACANIDSLHRMTRDERDLGGVVVRGSDHLTAYNLFAEAVNKHGFLGEVYGLPRHLFDDGLDDWAERRGVLIRAIEDIALGAAAVYRALEQPLPRQLPYASRELQDRFTELLARTMPFDLVIDEHTADGQEARVSRTSVAGSWGAVAGSLRFFSDRFGVARAGIEGTTLSYDLIRRHARQGPPRIELRGSRRQQRPVAVRRLDYFDFELETVAEELAGVVPAELRPAFADALTEGLLAGDTVHPNQARISRTLLEAGELHRRSGGRLADLSDDALKARLRVAVDGLSTWEEFLARRLEVDPVGSVPAAERDRLASLPNSVRLLGDQVPIDYEIERGEGIARLRLREGQVRRLRPEDLPTLDRPLHFAISRGRDPEMRAATLDELRDLLQRAPSTQRRRKEFRPPRHRRH